MATHSRLVLDSPSLLNDGGDEGRENIGIWRPFTPLPVELAGTEQPFT